MPGDECCYLCNECPNSYATLDELENHMNSAHVSSVTASNTKIQNWDSPEQNLEDGEENMEKSLNEEDMKIEDMNEEQLVGNSPTSSNDSHDDSLMDDHENHDDEEMDISSNGKCPTCRFCGRIFEDRSQLNVHYTHTHRDKPQYECDQCQLVFCVKRELSTHQRIHSGETPHKCGQCGKEFGTRQLLKKHNMWHTGERTHVCQHCGKAFFQKGHLTQHLMIHKGGRPHRCNQCEKTFIFKFDLNRHMKIHLERGHSCNKCGKSFLKQISLDEHILKCKRSPQTNGFRTPQSNGTRTSTPLSDISRNELNPSPRRISGIHLPTPLHPNVTTPNHLVQNHLAQATNGYSQEELAKLAHTLVAQQQQRVLAAAAQNLAAVNFFGGANGATSNGHTSQNGLTAAQTAAQLLFGQQHHQQQLAAAAAQNASVIQAQGLAQAQQANGSNQLFCLLCNKQYPNQAAYALHWSVVHFRNGVLNGVSKMEENELTQQNLTSSLFSQTREGLKREDSLNVHSDSATSSSCASSPQKISPVGTHNSPRTNSDSDNNSSTETSVTPDEQKTLNGTRFCEHCEIQRQKNLEIEKQLIQTQDELERLKEVMRRVGNIAGSLLHSCTDADKFWILHNKV